MGELQEQIYKDKKVYIYTAKMQEKRGDDG